MTAEEIEKVKEDVATADLEKVDLTLEEDAIAAMAESEGWRIMIKKANKIICGLLEPVDSTELPADANPLLIVANSFANAKALKIFREFINQAESVKKVRRIQAQKKQEEESNPGA